jgi:hypothetical protein
MERVVHTLGTAPGDNGSDRLRHISLPLLGGTRAAPVCMWRPRQRAVDDVGEEDDALDSRTVDDELTDHLIGLEIQLEDGVSESAMMTPTDG